MTMRDVPWSASPRAEIQASKRQVAWQSELLDESHMLQLENFVFESSLS